MTAPEMHAALAREDLCRYLAACYYEPEPAFEAEGVFSSILAAAQAIDEELVAVARALADGFRRATPDELLLDYTRLFLGPTNIPAQPYGSVWLEETKTLMGESTMAVLDLYREGGFEIDEDFRDGPDHVAVELEFLYLLLFRANEALRLGDAAQQEAVAGLKRRFLKQHLGLWVRPFAAAMRENAQTPFYRSLSELTERVVGMELARS